MVITLKDVEHMASLAKLRLKENEKEGYINRLNAFLAYIEALQELNTSGIPPTTHALPLENVFREDIERPCLPREKALANAPDSNEGYFHIPKIL